MKPLFIPLKTEFYLQFKSGEKKVEYRINGPRWNERTCKVGRPVILSRGYGKADRINGTITGFRCVQAKSSSCSYDILKSCYPDLQDYFYIAEIDIEIIEEE